MLAGMLRHHAGATMVAALGLLLPAPRIAEA
jgi:hypothetical protein